MPGLFYLSKIISLTPLTGLQVISYIKYRQAKHTQDKQMTTPSPARKIKSALTKAFPDTEFSVITHKGYDTVNVKWDMELGSSVTYDAVSAIAKPFETKKGLSDSYVDYFRSEGYSVDLYPKYSEAREDWAAECVTAEWNGKDAKWSNEWKEFCHENGDVNYHANKQYDNYLKNGVASNLDCERTNPKAEVKAKEIQENENKELIEMEALLAEKEIEVERLKQKIQKLKQQQKATIEKIILERAEGYEDECIAVEVTSWQEANIILSSWAKSAPLPSEGYEKCRIIFTFSNQQEVKTRFDLTQSHVTNVNLAQFLLGYWEWQQKFLISIGKDVTELQQTIKNLSVPA